MEHKGGKGHDCYELCQVPLAALKEQPPGKAADGVTFAAKNGQWTIWPHPRWGMPGPLDMEVYVLLLHLTAEQGFPRTVTFSAWELLQRLGWGTGAARYERLRLSLCRWQETTYAQSGLISCKGQTDMREDRFKVLQHVRTTARARTPWACTWTELLHWLIGSTFHRVALDPAVYLSLRPVAQATYRYLCARCFHRHKPYRENWRAVAHQRLGMTPAYPSQVKRTLFAALDELVDAAFLERHELIGETLWFHFVPPEGKPQVKPAANRPALPTLADVARRREAEWAAFKERQKAPSKEKGTSAPPGTS